MKKGYLAGIIIIAIISAAAVAVVRTGVWKRFYAQEEQEERRTRLVIPRENSGGEGSLTLTDEFFWEGVLDTNMAMGDEELVISVLNIDYGGGMEVQVVAYRSLAEYESPVYITSIMFDRETQSYKRMWVASTAAVQSGTVSLYTQDLIGDRNSCILVTGMNNRNEHTMTVFRRNPDTNSGEFYIKIAELEIDGSIVVQETGRTMAYQQGITRGQSFEIAAYGSDKSSENILDQVETIYAFNPGIGRYEEKRVTKIPGSQIEQRRLRELLSGRPGVFEEFIKDLWYYVSPEGTLDLQQYIYFDPVKREIIFFGDETQQIFTWQRSTPTRYGLYIISQNIFISTLRRFLDIELESLDSIRLRVSEDVHLKILVGASWDGSYRRASLRIANEREPVRPHVNAVYESSWGRLQFYNTGEYTINSGGTLKKGNYIFFTVNGQELLEMRTGDSADSRMTYRITAAGSGSGVLNLFRVRVGSSGIQDTHEVPVILNPVEQ
jgi:hypothetical protein